MINKKYIWNLADECLSDSDKFVVGININTENKVMVFIDGDNGVTITDCVKLSRFIENTLDREKEDFELNVSSAGVDQPFVLQRQYINNINNKVQVLTNDSKKITGTLLKVDEDKIELQEEIKNKNKKIKSTKTGEVITIPMNEINTTKRKVTF